MNNMRTKILSLLVLLLTAATGAWATDDVLLVTITAADNSSFTSGSKTFDNIATVTLSGEVYCFGDENGWFSTSEGTLTVTAAEGYTITRVKFYTKSNSAFDEEAPFEAILVSGMDGVNKIEVYGYAGTPAPAEPAIEVTTNAAEEGATFTEASFEMPTFDATADYELVRDMGVQMTATMGDGTDGVRYRVKKAQQGEGYEPADLNMMQVLALVAVNDGIEQKALTLNQDFFCRIYKLDEQTLQPVGDGMLLSEFNFAPGLYALKAFAQGGSDYDGETALSNTFKLFQGYEVEIAAGEYATFYKEENLYVEDEDAELYTITSVGSETATAAPLTVAKAYTPILVKNKGAEKKMILLIPTETEGDDVTAAPEFIGTLEATTIAASSENQNNYAFNGLQFVWVKNAIEVGPNKAWLAINTGVPSARGITLVFDETTKIANTNVTNITNGNWYDLNGRKLNGMPTKKGVYLFNGRKVVVK